MHEFTRLGYVGLRRDDFDLGNFDFGDNFGGIRKHMGGEGGAELLKRGKTYV